MKGPLHNKTTFLYARVSTEEQSRHGVSLPAQEHRLRAFAEATGRGNVELIVEDASAKTLRRTGLRRVLVAVRQRKAGAVIVLKLDRLTRNVRDLADLLDAFAKYGTALISVTESLDTSTAGGRLMLNLLASVSQWEREAIGERTAFALEHKRRKGLVYGPTPYGYRRIKDRLVPDHRQQKVLDQVREMRSTGKSLRAIGRQLQVNGAKNTSGPHNLAREYSAPNS